MLNYLPLNEAKAKEMLDSLSDRSAIFYVGVIPKPNDDVLVDYGTDRRGKRSFFSKIDTEQQSDFFINHQALRREKADLENPGARQYLELSQRYFRRNDFARLFSSIIIRAQHIFPEYFLTTRIIMGVPEIRDDSSEAEAEFLWVQNEVKRAIEGIVKEQIRTLIRLFPNLPQDQINTICLAALIQEGSANRAIRMFLFKMDDAAKKIFFNLDDNALQQAIDLAEDFHRTIDRLYSTIPKLLKIANGAKKDVDATVDYVVVPIVKSPKVFLEICWALLNESVSDSNINKDAMRNMVIDDGDTLGNLMANPNDDSHFGNLSAAELRAAKQALENFRKWVANGEIRDFQGNYPHGFLDRSEVELLKAWGATAVIAQASAPAAVRSVVPAVAVDQPQFDPDFINQVIHEVIKEIALLFKQSEEYFDIVKAINLDDSMQEIVQKISPLCLYRIDQPKFHGDKVTLEKLIDQLSSQLELLKEVFDGAKLEGFGEEDPELIRIKLEFVNKIQEVIREKQQEFDRRQRQEEFNRVAEQRRREDRERMEKQLEVAFPAPLPILGFRPVVPPVLLRQPVAVAARPVVQPQPQVAVPAPQPMVNARQPVAPAVQVPQVAPQQQTAVLPSPGLAVRRRNY